MEKERIVKTEVKIEGIADKGYGLSYQLINRNKDLSIEAKGIYNYLSSLAGKGSEAFPSVSLMLSELGISKTRFYKHREQLLENGLIRVEQGRAKYNSTGKISFDTSSYILLTDYDKIEKQKERYLKEKNTKSNVENTNAKQRKKERLDNVEHIENKGFDVCPQNSDTQNNDTQNKDNNNNSSSNNSFNNNNITTTKEKENIKNNSSSSSDVKLKFTLALKGITKTNIKKLKLNQDQIDLLESYINANDYDNLDKFSYFVAKEIKAGAITKNDLIISKSKKNKADIKTNDIVTSFRETSVTFKADIKEIEDSYFDMPL